LVVHKNNVGLIRLILASLVIFGHAPEQIDGSRIREPLTQIFHTISLGGLAVNGFFLLSGYLICKSMLQSPSAGNYLLRRCLRIMPAFFVAYLACILIMPPLMGGAIHAWPKTLIYMLALHEPPEYATYTNLPLPTLNGAMWTIAYEFRCYLLVMVLGITGLLRRPGLIAGATALLLGLGLFTAFPETKQALAGVDRSLHVEFFIGKLEQSLSLTCTFMVGVTICLWWKQIEPRLNGIGAIICLVALSAGLFSPLLCTMALVIFGAYILFWLAFKANLGPLQKINDRWDISYGVYLYGWPVASCLLWLNRDTSPLDLAVWSLLLALAFGTASWIGVERWSKDLGKRPRSKP
jgi:peptidoglycan/LPS O-acetylase OafA/YrhL